MLYTEELIRVTGQLLKRIGLISIIAYKSTVQYLFVVAVLRIYQVFVIILSVVH